MSKQVKVAVRKPAGAPYPRVHHAVELKGPWRVEVFRKNTIGCRFYDRYGFFENGQYTHEPSGEVTIRMSMHSA